MVRTKLFTSMFCTWKYFHQWISFTSILFPEIKWKNKQWSYVSNYHPFSSFTMPFWEIEFSSTQKAFCGIRSEKVIFPMFPLMYYNNAEVLLLPFTFSIITKYERINTDLWKTFIFVFYLCLENNLDISFTVHDKVCMLSEKSEVVQMKPLFKFIVVIKFFLYFKHAAKCFKFTYLVLFNFIS